MGGVNDVAADVVVMPMILVFHQLHQHHQLHHLQRSKTTKLIFSNKRTGSITRSNSRDRTNLNLSSPSHVCRRKVQKLPATLAGFQPAPSHVYELPKTQKKCSRVQITVRGCGVSRKSRPAAFPAHIVGPLKPYLHHLTAESFWPHNAIADSCRWSLSEALWWNSARAITC